MRVCNAFYGIPYLRGRKQGPQSHGVTGELVDAALLAVDHAHRSSADEPLLTQRFDRRDQGAARGDHVLDDADLLAGFELALDPPRRPVALRLLADEQEREPRRERPRRSEHDRAELGAREARRVRSMLADHVRDQLAQLPQQLRPRLEAVLVEVVRRALPRAEHEVALEVGMTADRRGELVGAHSAARAISSSRSASGPSSSESIEPSSQSRATRA